MPLRAKCLPVPLLLVVAACGSFGETPAAAGDGGTSDDAKQDGAGETTAGLGVRCSAGGTTIRCMGLRDVCCIVGSTPSCLARGGACGGTLLECDETADCPTTPIGSAVCCFASGSTRCGSTIEPSCTRGMCDPTAFVPCPQGYGACTDKTPLPGYFACRL